MFILNITRPSFSLALVHLSETTDLCFRTEQRVSVSNKLPNKAHGELYNDYDLPMAND